MVETILKGLGGGSATSISAVWGGTITSKTQTFFFGILGVWLNPPWQGPKMGWPAIHFVLYSFFFLFLILLAF
jgi:hypothetical protein